MSNVNQSTKIVKGRIAIETARLLIADGHSAILSKYADPIEDARDAISVADAEKVAAEDPGLIFLASEMVEFSRDRLLTAAGRAGDASLARALTDTGVTNAIHADALAGYVERAEGSR